MTVYLWPESKQHRWNGKEAQAASQLALLSNRRHKWTEEEAREVRRYRKSHAYKPVAISKDTTDGLLTLHQLEILQAVCRGLTNDQIARQFMIKKPSATVAIAEIKEFLNATGQKWTRKDLIAYAIEQGFVRREKEACH